MRLSSVALHPKEPHFQRPTSSWFHHRPSLAPWGKVVKRALYCYHGRAGEGAWHTHSCLWSVLQLLQVQCCQRQTQLQEIFQVSGLNRNLKKLQSEGENTLLTLYLFFAYKFQSEITNNCTYALRFSIIDSQRLLSENITYQVMKPLDVKTKFYNAESDEVFLEAQVAPKRFRWSIHRLSCILEILRLHIGDSPPPPS